MGQQRHIMMVALFSFAGMCAGATEEVGEPLPTFDEIITLVQQAATTRDELLDHSEGVCIVRSQRGQPWGETEAWKHLEPDETGAVWPSDQIESVTWAQRGASHRFEYTCEASSDAWGGCSSLSRRVSFDETTERIYEPDIETGFVSLPHRYGNFIQLPNTFDIDYFYGNSKIAPEAILPRLRKQGLAPKIAWSLVEGIPCIYLSFSRTVPIAGGYQDKSEYYSGFHFAPAMNYSLMKAVSVQKSSYRSDIRSYYVVEWLASYRESDTRRGIWLLENLTASKKQSGGDLGNETIYEKMTVNFVQTEIQAEVPEDSFTFRGMGIPVEASIYDVRVADAPISLEEREGNLWPHPDNPPWSMPSEMVEGRWVVAPLIPKFESEIARLSWPQLKAIVFDRAEAHAPYPRAFRMLALNRYRKTEEQQGKARALLEHGLAMQDDITVQGMIRPAFSSQSRNTYWADWGATAQALVEESLDHAPEKLSPLHVEALHRSITVMLPDTQRLPQERPIGFENAVRLIWRTRMNGCVRPQ